MSVLLTLFLSFFAFSSTACYRQLKRQCERIRRTVCRQISRPAKSQITIGETVIHYGDDNANRSQCHTIRRAQAYVLRAPASSTTVWPGDYIELSIPSVLDDLVVAVEPSNDYSPLCHQNWPEPAIVEAIGDKNPSS